MNYAEGSRWTAYEGVDRCYIGGPHNFPLTKDQAEGEAELSSLHTDKQMIYIHCKNSCNSLDQIDSDLFTWFVAGHLEYCI
jgi:hypothetical protein